MVEHDGEDKPFYFYKFYHIDHIQNPDWSYDDNAEEMGDTFNNCVDGYDAHLGCSNICSSNDE